ncbi:ABC-transporter [Infundibulicybe gibba]|nr:ABC-transporter [Infundibulicybe gibba]
MTNSPPGVEALYDSDGHQVELRDPEKSTTAAISSQAVDVHRAEQEFNALSRRLSARSDQAKQRDSKSTLNTTHDVEKGVSDGSHVFNLRDYLSSSNDANQKAGIKHKHVGVTWENLQVEVAGGINSKIYVGTLGGAIIMFFVGPLLWIWGLISHFLPMKPQPTRTILHKSSGVLKPGEMCLVLGCPGSGCTTFLKAIANQRSGYVNVSGEVLYAGIDAQEMEKHYKGEVVYNQEGRRHHIATLTVAQTLAFALSTKTPGPNGRLPGVSRKEFDSEVQDTLLRMLNISHTKQTLVGDEFVRGVSGGERKRVSIAEMMATRARVQCWDNSTRGLDASTALDFVKSLRVMTDVLGQTTFATFYQAGEGIYDLFDKVMVLDEGRQVFYGPPSEARAYFENLGYRALPRQSTADYLTGCTDPNERQFAPSRSMRDVPSSPQALERAYQLSSYADKDNSAREKYKILMETERTDQEAFRAAVAADKKKGVSQSSPYTRGFMGQVWALTVRRFQMRIQDKFQLYTSYTLCFVLAFVIGGAFYKQPLTSNGTFTRGSVIFAALLTTCLEAFAEMPMMMLGRPILRKQSGYSMYRSSATALANTLSDVPFSAVRILVFNIIVYFMSGLHPSAGAFWTFHLINYTAYLVMQGFFRTFGLMCHDFHSAFRLAVFFIPNFVEYAGYMIPVASMKRWLFWIYYINPIAYGWQACMENEFKRISRWTGPQQVCTLFGAERGSNMISGASYLSAGYGLDQYGSDLSIKIFAKENEDTKRRNEILREKRAERHGKQASDTENITRGPKRDIAPERKTFTWERLNYHVPSPNGPLRLLHDVYGYVKPGTLTALMGASGAGKTTCLDVLAQRKNIGVISGDVLVDGRPLDSDFARGTAYAEQMDVHEGTATVREAMRFSAYLRQPESVSQEEKDAYVEEMIELLELQDLAEALVFSLGMEARKRLTIGVELASKPELLLFLDEPTSGLDAQSAWNLVRFLRKLADQGQAILCTIHQPSSLLFESFDRLLLLETGGETVYFGDIGQDSNIVRQYFARHGAHCPPNVNPAEYMLEAIGAQVQDEINAIKSNALAHPPTNKQGMSTYATSFLYQLRVVVKRNNVALWRSPDYIFTRVFLCSFVSLFVSLSFLQLGNSARELQFRVFSIFWVTFLPAIVMVQIVPLFILNRKSSSRMYSPYAFAIGQLLGEIPYSIGCGIIYWLLMVYPIGFGQGSAGTNGTGFQLLIIIFMMIFGVSLGQLIAAFSPSVQVAVLFNPPIVLILTTFCGITIPYPTLLGFWKSWLYQLDPFTRTLAAMLSTELHGLVIKCKSDEFAIFDPPSGQTCMTWANEFVQTIGGYIDNPNDTTACRYCQYKTGDDFFVPLNVQYSHRWRDAFILFAFFVFNLIITILASRYIRYARR